jgi:hypothetical protein
LKPVTHRHSTRPARVNGLADIAVRNARARDRAYKLADGRGLCLLVQPNGSKWWRFRYDWDSKEKMLSVGTDPNTSLADARKRATKLDKRSKITPQRGQLRPVTDPEFLVNTAQVAPHRPRRQFPLQGDLLVRFTFGEFLGYDALTSRQQVEGRSMSQFQQVQPIHGKCA